MSIQNGPVEDGSLDATENEKIAGVIEQTRQDVAIGTISADQVDEVLRERFADAGLEVSEEDFRRFAETARG